ncbi:MAG: substrate-binding domain-containing protein [Kiloniellales bacterium]|nr:substrate-binding domain-containing protein [Kiloniellales bacterium]
MPAKSGVTLNTLAQELGLAKSTVSRALNGYPDIAEQTRERVRGAADRCGYRPSSMARNLKRGRVDTVGVVLTGEGPDIASPFFAQFLRGVTRALDREGLDLMVATAPGPDRWREAYDRLIASRKVDGFIVTRTETRDPRIAYLRQRGVPFVSYGRTENPSQYAWFDMDNRRAFAEATERLAGLGHRRIGFIAAPGAFNFARERLAGYRAARDALGLDDDRALIRRAGLKEADGWGAADALMALERPPTALICVRDAVAIGAARALGARGLRVGEEVSVIGYDDVPHAEFMDPPLTTFSQESETAGTRVAEMLLGLMRGRRAKDLQELRPAKLIERASDGPPGRTPESLRALLNAIAQRRGGSKENAPGSMEDADQQGASADRGGRGGTTVRPGRRRGLDPLLDHRGAT